MSRGKVRNVDVVADTSCIRCGVVHSKYGDWFAKMCARYDERYKMGFWDMKFPNGSFLRCSTGVEIPQSNVWKPVSTVEITKTTLDGQLGKTVRVAGFDPGVLGKDFTSIAIYRTRTAENEISDPSQPHGLEKRKASNNVVSVVLRWIRDAFAHIGGRGKVKDGNRGVLEQARYELIGIVDIPNDQRTPLDGTRVAGAEVVKGDRSKSALGKKLADVAPDKACTACHDHVLHSPNLTKEKPVRHKQKPVKKKKKDWNY